MDLEEGLGYESKNVIQGCRNILFKVKDENYKRDRKMFRYFKKI